MECRRWSSSTWLKQLMAIKFNILMKLPCQSQIAKDKNSNEMNRITSIQVNSQVYFKPYIDKNSYKYFLTI